MTDITRTVDGDVSNNNSITLDSGTGTILQGMTVIGGRTGSATGNNISVLISNVSGNDITVSDNVYLNDGDTLYFSSGLLLMGRHDDTWGLFRGRNNLSKTCA